MQSQPFCLLQTTKRELCCERSTFFLLRQVIEYIRNIREKADAQDKKSQLDCYGFGTNFKV